MPRNAEVIRQWTVLREIETARQGVTIDHLAELASVTTRTIRRDLEALQESGFALYDEKLNGKTYWKLEVQPFRKLGEAGLTLHELAALYFSRTLLEVLAPAPFHGDLRSAFAKLEAALPPRMRKFLDQLPGIIAAKPDLALRRSTVPQKALIARLLDATLHHRRMTMRYHSFSSGRVKDYAVEPYRLVYGQGGLYLSAYVPEYREMRTFAVERIEDLSVGEEVFTPIAELVPDAFPHSLGIHEGTPEPLVIEFAASVAPYILERRWHASQSIRDGRDGGLLLELNVCHDWALRAWILGFGPLARVVSPQSLADAILSDIDAARTRYIPERD
jgi:predicted DNA-binding transcriptional regulator YafY